MSERAAVHPIVTQLVDECRTETDYVLELLMPADDDRRIITVVIPKKTEMSDFLAYAFEGTLIDWVGNDCFTGVRICDSG